MTGLLDNLDKLFPFLKGACLVLVVVGMALGVAAVTYTLKTAFGPLVRVAQWLFWHTPGSRPNDVAAGVAHGGRR